MPAKRIRKDDDAKFSLRLPRDIKNWLDKKAESEGRSVNAHIIYLLGRIKEQDERISPKTLPYTESES